MSTEESSPLDAGIWMGAPGQCCLSSTVISAMVFFLSGIVASPSLACSCYGMSLEQSYQKADAVIEVKLIPGSMTGKAREVFQESLGRSFSFIENRAVVFDVSSVWKGEKVENVKTYDPSDTSCGVTFDENETYIVFADYRTTKNPTQDVNKVDSELEDRALFTHYCKENVRVRRDGSTQQIKAKLYRLQKEVSNTPKTSKYTEPLRLRIGEIVRSDKNLTPVPR